MKQDFQDRSPQTQTHPQNKPSQGHPYDHIVFDFTGLEQPDLCDLSLIITARLQSPPTESVWVRSLPRQTERVLWLCRLHHLFRHYPKGSDELN